MSVRNWVNQYIISLGPTADDTPKGNNVDASQVALKADSKVSHLSVDVEESGLRSVSGVDVSFEKIFELAQIPVPAHKYTVEKVGEMLRNPKLTALSKENRAAAILVALDSQGVKIEQVIEEGVKKEKALDVFEKVQRDNLKKASSQKEDENKKLQADIAEYTRQKQAVIDGNKKSIQQLESQINDWLTKKAQKEKEIYNIIQNFTTDNPVNIDAAREQTSEVKITDLTQSFKK